MQTFYTVRAGDTLNIIASRWSIPLPSLLAANNITNPSYITPGQQLSMPPGITSYVVQPGDTVFAISQQYGMPPSLIEKENGILSTNAITPGMVLTVPEGEAFYTVTQGDTLYAIAERYNVTAGGRSRPDLILGANPGLSPDIRPDMKISIPYVPLSGTGWLAVVASEKSRNYIELYDPPTGEIRAILVPEAGRLSTVFWSPSLGKIAYGGDSGTLYILIIDDHEIRKINQISPPVFTDWSLDSDRLIYSNGSEIRIYTVSSKTYQVIARPGASYTQWFPDGRTILFEAKDRAGISQLYVCQSDGSDERQITANTEFPYNEVRLSPNGRYVLYTSLGASTSEIYNLELATGFIYKISGGPEAKNQYPSWSPDSSQIAYSSAVFRNGRYYSLIRMSGFRGGGDATLAISDCYAAPVTWSPDSNGIAYLSGCRTDRASTEVWSIDLKKPIPVDILSGNSFYALDWSFTR